MANNTGEFHLSLSYAVPLTALNCLSSLVGTIGNTLVLVIIIKSSTLNSATDFLIMSLALADLLVTLAMQPMFTYHMNFYAETDDTTFDVILDITGYVSNIASIASMFAVTFDRFVAIRFPLKYKTILPKPRVFLVIIAVWICSTVFGIIFRLCSLSSGILWGTSSMLLLGTLSAYPYIFYVARRQEKLSRRMTAQVGAPSAEKTNRFRIFAEKKSTKTVAIVVGVFTLCWLPILVYTQIKKNSNKNDFLPGFFVVYTLSMWNSAFNPFIYCVRNHRYRVMFRKLLRRKSSVAATKTTGLDNHAVS